MILSLISFFVVLSILVLVHEWGHFFAAKRFGIWAEEFGLGLPPRAWGKKIGETIYSLNWLPIGGFVRLHGENLEDSITNKDRAFLNKSKFARTVVICAGVFMNVVLAIVIFSIYYSINGIPYEAPMGHVQIVGVREDSPAAKAGIVANDVVVTVDGKEFTVNKEFIDYVNSKKGEEVGLVVTRGSETKEIVAMPDANPAEGQGALGVVVSSSRTEYYFAPLWQRPILGVAEGFKDAFFWGKMVITGLRTMVVDLVGGSVPSDIAGPVGIYKLTDEVRQMGILPLMHFMGVLSLNLAIINILPIPALDGGRLLFIVFEAITRKRVTPAIEAKIHAVGMAILLLLILVITIVDIKRLVI